MDEKVEKAREKAVIKDKIEKVDKAAKPKVKPDDED